MFQPITIIFRSTNKNSSSIILKSCHRSLNSPRSKHMDWRFSNTLRISSVTTLLMRGVKKLYVVLIGFPQIKLDFEYCDTAVRFGNETPLPCSYLFTLFK